MVQAADGRPVAAMLQEGDAAAEDARFIAAAPRMRDALLLVLGALDAGDPAAAAAHARDGLRPLL